MKFEYTEEEVTEAIQNGTLFELRSVQEGNTIVTKLEPVSDLSRVSSVVACPWFYVILEKGRQSSV